MVRWIRAQHTSVDAHHNSSFERDTVHRLGDHYYPVQIMEVGDHFFLPLEYLIRIPRSGLKIFRTLQAQSFTLHVYRHIDRDLFAVMQHQQVLLLKSQLILERVDGFDVRYLNPIPEEKRFLLWLRQQSHGGGTGTKLTSTDLAARGRAFAKLDAFTPLASQLLSF